MKGFCLDLFSDPSIGPYWGFRGGLKSDLCNPYTVIHSPSWCTVELHCFSFNFAIWVCLQAHMIGEWLASIQNLLSSGSAHSEAKLEALIVVISAKMKTSRSNMRFSKTSILQRSLEEDLQSTIASVNLTLLWHMGHLISILKMVIFQFVMLNYQRVHAMVITLISWILLWFSKSWATDGPGDRSRSGTFRAPRVRSRPHRNVVQMVQRKRRRGRGQKCWDWDQPKWRMPKSWGYPRLEWRILLEWMIWGYLIFGNLQIWIEHRCVILQFMAISLKNGKIKHQICGSQDFQTKARDWTKTQVSTCF